YIFLVPKRDDFIRCKNQLKGMFADTVYPLRQGNKGIQGPTDIK
ncbi:hypothetical protein A2U01_0099222, partial [Trifolium medium]|nr:hypothetical protein [Trifolium medium]